eukprot:2761668-Alexandrium_andersonii.AAC.1
MAKQSRGRSASGSRANSGAAGGGKRRTRNRSRSAPNESKRATPRQPARKLCAAYKAGNCKEGTTGSSGETTASPPRAAGAVVESLPTSS